MISNNITTGDVCIEKLTSVDKDLFPITSMYRDLVNELIQTSQDPRFRKELIRTILKIKDGNYNHEGDLTDIGMNSLIIKELVNMKGFSINELNLLKQYIFSQNFIEGKHFLNSLRDFINSAFSYLDMISFKYNEREEILEYYGGNKELDMNKIYLKDMSYFNDTNCDELDYINEIEAAKDTNGGILHSNNTTTDNGGGLVSFKMVLPRGEKIIVSIKMKETLFDFNEDLLTEQLNRINSIFSNTLLMNTSNLLIANIKTKYKDDLTGLYNKEYLHTVTKGKRFSVINIDVDNFKSINDTYGHIAGDRVLKKVSGILRRVTKGNDKVCRVGGDEFVVLISTNNKKELENVMERITEYSNEQLKFNFQEKRNCDGDCNNCITDVEENFEVQIGLSVGGVVMDKGKSITEMMNEADKDMYDKKTDEGKMYRVLNQLNTISDYDILAQIYTELFGKMLAALGEEKLLGKDFKDIFQHRIEQIKDPKTLERLSEVLSERMHRIT